MDKEPNKNNEPNEEAKVLSDEELEGVVGGALKIYNEVSMPAEIIIKDLAERKDLAELN